MTEMPEQKDDCSPQDDGEGPRRGRLMLFYSSWMDAYKQYPSSIGFPNREGVFCFRNCALAVLLHLPVFINWLELHLEDPCSLSLSGKDCITCHLAHLSKYYWSSDVSTEQIYNQMHRVWKICQADFWSSYDETEQQDCPEFLTMLIQNLKDEPKGVGVGGGGEGTIQDLNSNPILEHMFKTILKNRDTCNSCKVVKYRGTDSFSIVGASVIPVKRGEAPIEQCINQFLGSGQVTGLGCEYCEHEPLWNRRSLIRDAPEVLVVQLDRFTIGASGAISRNAGRVSFKEDLDLTEHLDTNFTGEKTGEQIRYKLNAVVLHKGHTIRAGHYVCYVKGPTGEWSFLDDDIVKRTDIGTTLKCHQKGFVPYVLVYTRQPLLSGPPVTLPQPNVSLTLEEDDDDASAVQQKKDQPELVEEEEEEEEEEEPPEDGSQPSDDGDLTPDDGESDGVLELAGSSTPSLSTNIRLGAGALRPEGDEKWEGETRWEGQPAKVFIKIEMEDAVLTGHLRGVLKKKRKRNAPLSAAAKPQGVTKAGRAPPTK